MMRYLGIIYLLLIGVLCVNCKGDKTIKISQETYEEMRRVLAISKDIEDNAVFLLKFLMIQKVALDHQRCLKNRFYSLASGKTICGWNAYFPIIQPKSTCIKKGEYFETVLSVGLYMNPLDNRFVVNGDTINVDDSGTATYKIKTQKRGEIKLGVECSVINSLTGVVNKGTSEYSYMVY